MLLRNFWTGVASGTQCCLHFNRLLAIFSGTAAEVQQKSLTVVQITSCMDFDF